MFFATLLSYKHSKEPKLIEMLSYANNVSFKNMADSYYTMQKMLNKLGNKQKQK